MKATAPSMVWNHQGRGQRDIPSLAAPSLRRLTSHKEKWGAAVRAHLGVSRGGRRSVRSAAVLEQPRGARPGPGAPVEPSNGSLITRHHGGMEALPTAANPRAVTTETTLTLHRLQRVLCVCLCVLLHLPPPLVVFCVRVRKKELGFFSSFLGSIWHRGSDHVKSEIRVDGWTDEPGEPATIAQRLGSLLKGEGEGLWGMEAAVVLTRQK